MIEAITYVTCRQRMVNLMVVPFLSYLKVCQSPIPGCTWIFASYYKYRYTLYDYVFIKRLLCQALRYWMSLSSLPCKFCPTSLWPKVYKPKQWATYNLFNVYSRFLSRKLFELMCFVCGIIGNTTTIVSPSQNIREFENGHKKLAMYHSPVQILNVVIYLP